MAFVVTDIGTLDAEDAAHTFEILEEGGTPASTAIELRRRGYIDWERLDRDKWGAVMTGQLVWPVRDFQDALQARLFEGAEGQFKFRWKKSGQVMWTGLIDQEIFKSSFDRYSYDAEIVAVDPLATLQTTLYDDEGAPFDEDDRITLVQGLADLLALTGEAFDLRVTCNWRPWRSTDPISGDPLAALTFDRGRFTSLIQGGQKVVPVSADIGRLEQQRLAPDAWDVLLQLAGRFGLCVKQYGNAWHIQQRSEMQAGSFAEYLYSSDGTFQSSQSVNPVLYSFADKTAAKAVFKRRGTTESKAGLKSASVSYQHGPIGGTLLRYPGFESDESTTVAEYQFAEWGTNISDAAAAVDVFQRGEPPAPGAYQGTKAVRITGRAISYDDWDEGAGTDPATRRTRWMATNDLPDIAVNSQERIQFRFAHMLAFSDGRPRQGSRWRYAWLRVKCGARWLERDADDQLNWVETETWIKIGGSAGGVMIYNWQTESIDVEAPASGGTLECTISNPVETFQFSDGLGGYTDAYDVHLWIDDVQIDVVGGQSGVNSTKFTAELSNTTSRRRDEGRAFVVGDGPNTYLKGRLQFLSDGQLTEAWKIGTYGVGEARFEYEAGKYLSLSFLLASVIVKMESQPLEDLQLEGRVAEIGEVGPIHVIEQTGTSQRWDAIYLRRWFDAGEGGSVEADFTELRWDALWPNETRYEERSTPSVLGPGDGQSKVLGLRNENIQNQLVEFPFTHTVGVHLASDSPYSAFDVEAITGTKHVGLTVGRLVHIVDRRGLGDYGIITARLTQDVQQDDTQIHVEDKDNPGTGITLGFDLSPKSGVYVGNGDLLAILGFNDNFFLSRFEADRYGYTAADYDGPRTSIVVDENPGLADGIRYKLPDNYAVHIYPKKADGTYGDPFRAFASQTSNAGDRTVEIDDGAGGAVTFDDVPAGSLVAPAAGALGTEIANNAVEVSLRAYEEDVLSSFETQAAGVVQTDLVSSSGSKEIHIDPLPVDLPDNTPIRVYYRTPAWVGGLSVPMFKWQDFTLNGHHTAGVVDLDTNEAISENIPANAWVLYRAEGIAQRLIDNEAELTVQATNIAARVSSRSSEADFELNATYAGTSRNDQPITITGLDATIYVGDKFLLERLSDGMITRMEATRELVGNGGSQSLYVGGVGGGSVDVYGVATDPIFYGKMAGWRLDSESFIATVERFASDNWNATVSGGQVTAHATQGFGMLAGGDAAFGDDLWVNGNVHVGSSMRMSNDPSSPDWWIDEEGFHLQETIGGAGKLLDLLGRSFAFHDNVTDEMVSGIYGNNGDVYYQAPSFHAFLIGDADDLSPEFVFSVGADGAFSQGLLSARTYLSLQEQATAPTAAATGFVRVYPKTDGNLYIKNDAGTETQLGGGGLDPDTHIDLNDDVALRLGSGQDWWQYFDEAADWYVNAGTKHGGTFAWTGEDDGGSGRQLMHMTPLSTNGNAVITFGLPTSAPGDTRFWNSSWAPYLDQTANELKVKVRYSTGAYKTGTLCSLA